MGKKELCENCAAGGHIQCVEIARNPVKCACDDGQCKGVRRRFRWIMRLT